MFPIYVVFQFGDFGSIPGEDDSSSSIRYTKIIFHVELTLIEREKKEKVL